MTHQIHSVEVAGGKDRVWAAVKEVTPDEIRRYGTLGWIQRLGRSGTGPGGRVSGGTNPKRAGMVPARRAESPRHERARNTVRGKDSGWV